MRTRYVAVGVLAVARPAVVPGLPAQAQEAMSRALSRAVPPASDVPVRAKTSCPDAHGGGPAAGHTMVPIVPAADTARTSAPYWLSRGGFGDSAGPIPEEEKDRDQP
ncbi:hypothetical protein GCM10018772_22080 [Streptomyces fumanus]|uniref:Uncharacterized protein n=1 Tax=Streptomyces fumanus TaxID=67302 RepID=A0A919ACT6_9ACTN|nr:hypothetical protein GCM10018772_22080 [Streptomyces fumanus]